MRRISCHKTIDQVEIGTKTVTRRNGWKHARPGDLLLIVDKIRTRERVRGLAIVRVVKVTREPLLAITDEEVAREGFAGKSTEWFITMFTRDFVCTRDDMVTRVEWRYLWRSGKRKYEAKRVARRIGQFFEASTLQSMA
uniref:ASCH domain-containing protein n=1 Tax=Candidatus Kentrum sp. LFY TaxID=2126342 RepID=A0A450WI93_9GAMM|nr:MAG: hypothetical protein BECKLFY1418C_GA0070996_102551 [Candidatus Kentron sp. LFY]